MPDYRRTYQPNQFIFITCVTANRKPIFSTQENQDLFWATYQNVVHKHPFNLVAFVLLPDHFHWLVEMPNADVNFSKIMMSLKWNFTLEYKKKHQISTSLVLWQRGFWDHVIRDEDDFQKHLDYIHWNPVKHDHARRAFDWKYSSFQDWVAKGVYDMNWGQGAVPKSIEGLILE